MWCRRSLCRLLEPLVMALVVLQLAGPAAAAGDAHHPEALLLATRINGFEVGDAVMAMQFGDGALGLRIRDLETWRVDCRRAVLVPVDGQDYVRLDRLPGVRYVIEPGSQTLLLTVPPRSFLASTPEDEPRHVAALDPSLGALFLNYDVQQTDSGGSALANGLFELGYGDDGGHGSTSQLWRGTQNTQPWVRLDSSWIEDDPDRMQTVRVGDTISRPGPLGRAVRLGGLQWTSNFGTQPGFVSFPLPSAHGEAALPSTYEVFADHQRVLHGEVAPGTFDIRNIPALNGAGQIQVVVHDALGRQQTITESFYASPMLLREGLEDFSVEAGALREDYGAASNHYGPGVLLMQQRIGLTDALTRELKAEFLNGTTTLGGGATWLVADFGTVNLEFAASHARQNGATVQTGFGHQARTFNLSGVLQYATRAFSDVGIRPSAAPRATANLALALPWRDGGISLAWAYQTTWQGEARGLAAASYGWRLGALGQLMISASHQQSASDANTVMLLFTHLIDAQTSASGSAGRAGRYASTDLQLQRSAPVGTGYGYHLADSEGTTGIHTGGAVWQTSHATLTADVASTGGTTASRMGMNGALVLAGGSLFATRHIDDSFAVVKVADYPGVTIRSDNHPVAVTDAQGTALVMPLRAWQRNRLSPKPCLTIPLSTGSRAFMRR